MKNGRVNPMFSSLPSLTSRQWEVWDYLSRTISGRGICPSYREIAEHLKIQSSYGVRTHLDALERKGYLKRIPNRSRAITLLQKKSPGNFDEIPRLGTILGNKVLLSSEYSGRNRLPKSASYPYVSLYVEAAPTFFPQIERGSSLLLRSFSEVVENRTCVWMTPEHELVLGSYVYHSLESRYAIQRVGETAPCFSWKKWIFLGIMKGWLIPPR